MISKIKLFNIVFFLATIAAPLSAQPPAKVDPGKGEMLFTLGVPTQNVPSCISCHGDAGNSPTAVNPKLAGQHAAYTTKQLSDFKKRTEREHAAMSLYAQALSDEDMRNISAYLAQQKLKPGIAKYQATIDLGQKIFRAGIADRHVPACASCHGPSGAGIPIQYPRINGQWADYTEAQLFAFRSGTRKNSAPMSAIALKLTDAEIKAVADYIAGLR
jgi:cytochrome c553